MLVFIVGKGAKIAVPKKEQDQTPKKL